MLPLLSVCGAMYVVSRDLAHAIASTAQSPGFRALPLEDVQTSMLAARFGAVVANMSHVHCNPGRGAGQFPPGYIASHYATPDDMRAQFALEEQRLGLRLAPLQEGTNWATPGGSVSSSVVHPTRPPRPRASIDVSRVPELGPDFRPLYLRPSGSAAVAAPPLFIVGILSKVYHFEKREACRDTWLRFKRPGTVHVFVLAVHPGFSSGDLRRLRAESLRSRDLLVLPIEER